MPSVIKTYLPVTALSEPLALPGITFTHAINGAEQEVFLPSGKTGELMFACKAPRDLFCDPNGKISQHTLPMLLTEIDNTQPFTLTAKVKPGFTPDGTFNSANLLLFVHETLWQKLCFEQDEHGCHRIVSVRTQGFSDDNNHEQVKKDSVWLRISSDTNTVSCFYSEDNMHWHLVRLYQNYYPARIFAGIASQCPVTGSCVSLFEDVTLEQNTVADMRLG